MKQFKSYVICTSPRSGSTLLCTLLSESGNAGLPDSHFHEPSLEKWLDYCGLRRETFRTRKGALEAVFKSVFVHGKGQTDVFGLRLQRQSFKFFVQQLSVLFPSLADDKSRIEAAFGETLFIHLTRQDKLDQAISFVKASQSGLWHKAPDGTELERLSEPKEPFYDQDAIAAQLDRFVRMDAEWEAWFAEENIEPFHVTYDALASSPYGTLTRVLHELGLKLEAVRERAPPVARLADATNREWADRFRCEPRT